MWKTKNKKLEESNKNTSNSDCSDSLSLAAHFEIIDDSIIYVFCLANVFHLLARAQFSHNHESRARASKDFVMCVRWTRRGEKEKNKNKNKYRRDNVHFIVITASSRNQFQYYVPSTLPFALWTLCVCRSIYSVNHLAIQPPPPPPKLTDFFPPFSNQFISNFPIAKRNSIFTLSIVSLRIFYISSSFSSDLFSLRRWRRQCLCTCKCPFSPVYCKCVHAYGIFCMRKPIRCNLSTQFNGIILIVFFLSTFFSIRGCVRAHICEYVCVCVSEIAKYVYVIDCCLVYVGKGCHTGRTGVARPTTANARRFCSDSNSRQLNCLFSKKCVLPTTQEIMWIYLLRLNHVNCFCEFCSHSLMPSFNQ